MQATSPFSLGLLPSRLLLGKPLHRSAPFVTTTATGRSFICASRRDHSHGHRHDGKLVDENMIILRWRIREIEMEEKKGEARLDWSEWEKKYFANYESDMCEAVGLLQRMLMDTRPCVSFGILALVLLSMSVSTSQVVFHLVDMAKEIII